MSDPLIDLMNAMQDGVAPDGAHTWTFTPGEAVPVEQLAQMGRDMKDGAALRRLREAGADMPIAFFPMVGSWRVVSGAWIDDYSYGKDGATIAEAADKCREALLGSLDGSREP